MGRTVSATPATSTSRLRIYLQQALARSGLGTQTALARAAGLDPSYVSKIVGGHIQQPTLVTLSRLADALQVPLADLAAAAGYVVPAAPDPPTAPLPPTLGAIVTLLLADAAWATELETIGPAQTALVAALARAWQAQARAVLAARRHPVTKES
jgi:transcriptional regulator with XRE-family HTH domain